MNDALATQEPLDCTNLCVGMYPRTRASSRDVSKVSVWTYCETIARRNG